VSIQPQAYLVSQIAGDRVTVEVLVPPGESPETFSPSPQQLARLSGAAIYFRVGMPFEEQLVPRLRTMQHLRIIDTSSGIHKRQMTEAEAAADHDEGEAHAAGLPDPHTWLSPVLAAQHAANIAAALTELDPAGKAVYADNLARLDGQLKEVDQQLREALAPLKGQNLFVFHPAYGYFADAYGLRQVAVEIGGHEPSARQIAHLIDTAKAAHARVIFVQPQFSQRSAKAIASAIGGVVAPLDPLAYDYIANLRAMAEAIKQAAN